MDVAQTSDQKLQTRNQKPTSGRALSSESQFAKNNPTVNSPLTKMLALGAAAFGLCASLNAEEPAAILLRVEQANKSDMNAKDRISRTHSRKLHIFVTNNSSNLLDLKVKFEVFGRSMLTHEIVKINEGEMPLQVKPHSAAYADSIEAKSTSSEQHWDAKAKKMIEPSGATIIGAGVQVLQGAQVLTEWYDPESLKEKWGKAQPLVAAKPGTAPAKPTATPVKPKSMLARE